MGDSPTIALLALAGAIFAVAGGFFLLSNNSFIDDYRYELDQTLTQIAEEKLYTCTSDTECVLVQDGWCGTIVAIRKDKKSEWEKEDKDHTEKARQNRQTCKPTSQEYLEIENFQAVCEQSRCKAKFIGESPQDLDTSIWQTYRNEEYGFEVRYPSSEDDSGFGWRIITEELSLEEYLKELNDRRTAKHVEFDPIVILKKNDVQVGPYQAIQYETAQYAVPSFSIETYFQVTDGTIINFVTWRFDESITESMRQLNNQILSTFRFVDEEDVEGTRKVKLFYYNKNYDPKFDCLSDAVLSVEREIPQTKTPIQDTIKLLIEGKLTEKETAEGFSTEFPHPEFKLFGANLKDGVLTLDFPEVPSFTTGGSCRIGLLRAQVEKTARQFSKVRAVRYTKEGIFQP